MAAVNSSSSEPSPDPSDRTEQDKAVQSPHDRLVNRMLEQDETARSLIEFHLPSELTSYLKLDSLTVANTSFIDPNLKRRFADRLLSVEVDEAMVRSLGMKTNYVYLLLLIDHKSNDHPNTVIQLLGYIVRIWENMIENRQPLAPIIPWVIYNGVRPWRSAKSLCELIPVPESWKRYVPGLELPILDVCRMADSEMKGEPILQITLTLLKYGREQDLEMFLRPMFQLLAEKYPGLEALNWLDTIRRYVMSVNPVVGEKRVNAMISDFWPVQPEPGSVADQLIKQGEQKGLDKGREQGREEGREEGKLAGRVLAFQEMLGEPLMSDSELLSMSVEELDGLIVQLQQRLRSRS